MTTRADIERVLWNACDSFRGKIDSSRYKDYILSMLFVKYLSDVTKEKREKYMEQYNGDERRVERAMSRERFSVDRESTFDFLYSERNSNEMARCFTLVGWIFGCNGVLGYSELYALYSFCWTVALYV